MPNAKNPKICMKNRKDYGNISISGDAIRAFRFRLTENGYFWDNQGKDPALGPWVEPVHDPDRNRTW